MGLDNNFRREIRKRKGTLQGAVDDWRPGLNATTLAVSSSRQEQKKQEQQAKERYIRASIKTFSRYGRLATSAYLALSPLSTELDANQGEGSVRRREDDDGADGG